MKLEGVKRVQRRLKKLPPEARNHVVKAIRRSTDEGERLATTLAPDVTHETRGNIHGEISENGLRGEILAIRSDAPREDKDRAYSIEYGRKKGIRGITYGYKFMWFTRQYLAKKHYNRVRRAIRQAIKVSANG